MSGSIWLFCFETQKNGNFQQRKRKVTTITPKIRILGIIENGGEYASTP